MIQISNISENNILNAAKLATDCFIDNKYFSSYKKKGTRGYNALFRIITKSIEICKKYGVAQQANDDDQFVGLLLAFDYYELKKNLPEEFLFFFSDKWDSKQSNLLKETLTSIEEAVSSTNTMYLMAVGVASQYRNRGFATQLIGNFVLNYRDYQIVTDITDTISQKVCLNMGFKRINSHNDKYSIYVKEAENEDFEIESDDIYVAVPCSSKLLDHYPIHKKIKLNNLIQSDGACCFESWYKASADATVYKINKKELLCLENYFDFTKYKENAIKIDDINVIYYTPIGQVTNNKCSSLSYYMKKRKEIDDNLIVDLCTSIPMIYQNIKIIHAKAKLNGDLYSKVMISALDFRNEYESGIPVANYFERGYKDRINRICLGNIKVQLKSETQYQFGKQPTQTDIGNIFDASLILSIDRKSNICVLHIMVLSFGEELTQYLDCVSRNQITVVSDNKTTSLYDYLYVEYGLQKVGVAKTMITSFEHKEDVNQSLLSSIMFGETYYQPNEGLSTIVDDEIVKMISSEHGVSQYSYADVLMHTNVIFQASSGLMDLIKNRIVHESITIFYIELVLFEEAAICFADSQIKSFLANMKYKSPKGVLKSYTKQLEMYALTIDFWNVQMNYPSSQSSIGNIRNHFKIENLKEQYNRNSEIFQKIYETKNNYVEKVETSLLTTVGAILTVISIIELLWDTEGYNKLSVAGLIIGILLFIKDKFILKRDRKKTKKHK